MIREILEDLRQKTADCTKNYRCLSCDPSELCEIKPGTDDDGACFIECITDSGCVFLEIHDKSGISLCKCPVRKELHLRYQV